MNDGIMMSCIKKGLLGVVTAAVVAGSSLCFGAEKAVPGRWSVEKANEWYKKQPWLIGCNYLPANSINQIDMWQAETFDPETIEKELDLAESIGFNTLRVYFHDLVWEADPEGFYGRVDKFLDICKKRNMKPMFVFFDDCHHPVAKLGVQPLPVAGYHNSGWVNSPARDVALAYAEGTATDKDKARLKGYVVETIARFKDDDRVLAWELYNEPGSGTPDWMKDKTNKLLRDSWKWARSVNPSQPVTSTTSGSVGEKNIEIGLVNSDIISFHAYRLPKRLEMLIKRYSETDRPLFCTEYMARPNSTFQNYLPILKKNNIASYSWGFVAGKSGTIFPWSSKKNKDVNELRAKGIVVKPGEEFPEPELWHHEIFRMDGTPFSQEEVDFIKTMTGK